MSEENYLKDSLPSPEDTIDFEGVNFQHQQIVAVVQSFYTEIAKDEKLSLAFSKVEDWTHHFEIMTHFWWVRLGGRIYIHYPYNPFKKHFENGFTAELLSRWLELFRATLTQHLDQRQLNAWFLLAQAIGRNLLIKNDEIIRILNSK